MEIGTSGVELSALLTKPTVCLKVLLHLSLKLYSA